MNDDEVGAFLERVRAAVAEGHVVVSDKATREVTENLGWDQESVFDELYALQIGDYLRSESSIRRSDDTIHTFTPPLDEDELWIRLVERGGLIVVSFHRG